MIKKIGVLGMGSIGSRHFHNLRNLGHEVKFYDTQPYWGMNGVDRDRLIEWADAIVIASPTYQHDQDIIDCQSAGKPMFVEKPLISQNKWVNLNHIVMVGYNLRFHSCVKQAKLLMGTGRIGKPLWARFICAQYSDKPAYLRDGVTLNWSHEIDLAGYLLGAATLRCAAVVRSGPNAAESVADLVLFHDSNGCQSVVHLDYLTRPERRGFLIVGQDGVIECDLVSRQLTVHSEPTGPGEFFRGDDSFDDNYISEMKAFIARLEGHESLGCNADEGLQVAKICFEANKRGMK